MLMDLLCEAWETWDGSEGRHVYKHIVADSDNDAHAAALEFAFTLLDPYMNDIKNYAEYRAEHFGDDPRDIIHQTMLECAHYELWEKYYASI